MDQTQFTNALKRMSFIEGFQLPELTAAEQSRFMADPTHYFIRASDAHAAAIWREITRPIFQAAE